MEDKTAGIGAQAVDHEAPKEHASSDLEENMSTPSALSSKSSIDGPGHDNNLEESHYEMTEEEVDPPPVKVPRSQRRGLFGRFTILAEVEEPKHYSRRTKWFITFVIALAAVAAPLGSTIIFR